MTREIDAGDVTIRAARDADLDGVVGIYNHYVITSHVTFDLQPLAAGDRRPWFDAFGSAGPYRLWVGVCDGEILGYTCSTRLRPKPAYDVSVETTCYVAPDACGLGLGRRLYEALIDSLSATALHRAFAGIALPNPASIALHERLGYRCVGRFSEVGYKFGRYWDVAWYERPIGAD